MLVNWKSARSGRNHKFQAPLWAPNVYNFGCLWANKILIGEASGE